MLSRQPHHGDTAVAAVRSCLSDATDLTLEMLRLEDRMGGLPALTGVLSSVVASVLGRYSSLLGMEYEDALRTCALRAAKELGSVELETAVRLAMALVTAEGDEGLLSLLLPDSTPAVGQVLSEMAAALLSNIQEIDFSDPCEVLARCVPAP